MQIIEWSKQKFLSSEIEWQSLLSQSYSNHLFMSWIWLSTWWEVFKDNTMTLKLLAVYDNNKRLVALAPLYIKKTNIRYLLTSKRLQPIGNCWRDKDTMRTELLDFIIAKQDVEIENSIFNALFDYIDALTDWDELVLNELPASSKTYQAFYNHPISSKYFTRIAEQYESYNLMITGNFENYLSQLSSNTRRHLYNKRKQLHTYPDINIENIGINKGFETLNELHKIRWNSPAFENNRRTFNNRIAEYFSVQDSCRFSVISIHQVPVSIQYNYLINNQLYNISSAFNENFDNKIPLGSLHFGYEIEFCFRNNIAQYKFLAGSGKHINYKSRLTNDSVKIFDIQVVKSPIHRLIYKLFTFISKRQQ